MSTKEMSKILKGAREAAHMRQLHLAIKLGIKADMLAWYEKDCKDIPIGVFLKWCRILKVDFLKKEHEVRVDFLQKFTTQNPKARYQRSPYKKGCQVCISMENENVQEFEYWEAIRALPTTTFYPESGTAKACEPKELIIGTVEEVFEDEREVVVEVKNCMITVQMCDLEIMP
jgi:transcriptional regulator with XRE-family HTH domain